MKTPAMLPVTLSIIALLAFAAHSEPPVLPESLPGDLVPELKTAISGLYSEDTNRANDSLGELARMTNSLIPVIHFLLPALSDQRTVARFLNRYETIGSKVADLLGTIGKPCVEPLLSMLDQEVRKDFHGGDTVFRKQNIFLALGKIRDSRATIPLVEEFNRRSKAEGIHFFGNEEYNLVKALASIGAPQSAAVLAAELRSQSFGIRREAARGLGNVGDMVYFEVLLPLLADESLDVRKAVKYSLNQITKQDFGEDRAKWETWWKQVKQDKKSKTP